MNRLFFWFAIAFFILAPIRFGWVLYRDLNRPETWGDWQCNPNVYLPMAATVALLAVVLGLRIFFAERRSG